MKSCNKALLPAGFADLLSPDVKNEHFAIGNLLDLFDSLGYGQVKPPIAEFEDSILSAFAGKGRLDDSFRLMDPDSKRMMVFRSDVTPQVARIVSSRLDSVPRPIRLCYAEDVLRVGSFQLRTAKQFCKIGAELIGDDALEADIEIAVMALMSLKKLGVRNITIDLTIPKLVGCVYDSFDTDKAIRKQIDEYLDQRDSEALLAMDIPETKMLAPFIDNMGNSDAVIDRILNLDLPDEGIKLVKRLQLFVQKLELAIKDMDIDGIDITIDLQERRGFGYHTGIAFTLFSADVRGEIGRGGRYEFSGISSIDEVEGEKETAVGFTLYMDTLRKVLPDIHEKEAVEISAKTSWKEIKGYIDGGYKVNRKG